MRGGERLPLLVYDSILRTGALIDDNLAVKINSLNVERQIYGGYWQLASTMNTTQSVGQEWLESGLARHVELYSPGASMIWEGFINSISFNIGGVSKTRGPLIGGVANKIKVLYTPTDTSITPPAMGSQDKIDWSSNTISQAKYGIHEQILNVGGGTATSAAHFQATALAERAEPKTSESDNLASSSVPSVSITALGYAHWLQTYTVDLTTEGDQDASDKLAAVLAADPNSLFGTTAIEANTVQVGAYDRDYRIADSIVKGIVALGSATNDRTMFGLTKNRQVIYKTVPSSPIYQRRIAEAHARLEAYGQGATIQPYDVRVGEMVFYTDLLAGKPPADSVAISQSDPRYLRIGRATYTLPIALTLAGEQYSQLDSIMAQYGLGGRTA